MTKLRLMEPSQTLITKKYKKMQKELKKYIYKQKYKIIETSSNKRTILRKLQDSKKK